MALADQIAVFLVGLVIGGIGIYIGARAVTGADGYRHAIVTALIGALVWAIFGIIPIIGPVLALLAWIAVINARYEGGWVDAVLIGLTAWLSTLVILYILTILDITAFQAVGIPEA